MIAYRRSSVNQKTRFFIELYKQVVGADASHEAFTL
jgi:hypothetical protein